MIAIGSFPDDAITIGFDASYRLSPNAKKYGDASSGNRSWNVPSSCRDIVFSNT